MMFKSVTIATALATLAVAQRPSNTSICDYYTTALLKNNTAANQATLLTLVVNTAVIGNYTQPNVGIAVAGILAPGEFNGTAVNLLPYFNGGLASTNNNGTAISVNFLDGGGATPLQQNKPADSNDSAQYILITHLYSYFGGLLGCSMMGGEFPVYSGSNSQYDVHKFMDLSAAEVGYFIQQVATSAASFGVATEDLTVVGTALNSLFNYKCTPETVVIASQPAGLQSICIGDGCQLAPNADCAAYGEEQIAEPSVAVSSLVPTSTSPVVGTPTAAVGGGATSAAGSPGATAAPSGVSTAGASANGVSGVLALALGFAALL